MAVAWGFVVFEAVLAVLAIVIVLKLEKERPTASINPKTDAEVVVIE